MAHKILIVDDDPTIVFLHKTLMIKRGITDNPLTFLNGKEAYDYLEEEKPGESSYVILLDINMPVMNGWQFLDKLEKDNFSSRIDVAIVTSSVDKADREKASSYDSVVAYLTKPFFNLDEVKEIVSRHKEAS